MPTYSHQCQECGEKFDDSRPYEKSNKKPRCPKCKSRKTKKLISSPFVVYVGDGFTKQTKAED